MTKFKAFTFDKRSTTTYSFPVSHFDGYNLWLLKPTHLNRGRGIHVFRDLETLNRLIKDYCAGKDEELKTNKKDSAKEEPTEMQPPGQVEEPLEQQSSPNTNKSKVSLKKNAYKIKHNTFII